jgi:hypothetical protein
LQTLQDSLPNTLEVVGPTVGMASINPMVETGRLSSLRQPRCDVSTVYPRA